MSAARVKLRYVSLPDMYYLMEGLSFKVAQCADVLDHALVMLNEQTKIPDKIVAWNKNGGNLSQPLSFPDHGRIIVDITERLASDGRLLLVSEVLKKHNEKEKAPVAFFTMRSLSLDVPMRVEVPLRALIKGAPKLRGTYSVYLHALLDSEQNEFVYYGITKRGWSMRFTEHTKAALQSQSRRLFPLKLNDLIEARVAELAGQSDERPKLTGVISAICAIGLDEDAAMDTEEYLVDKYSLSSKHPHGLNMIPGGREGIRVLHSLSLGGRRNSLETEEREAVLDDYLRSHPQLGIPKPGIAEKWNDPAYAEAVICARENRLSADQVREIRYLAAMGMTTGQIRAKIGALDDGQVRRVIGGRTYSRIQ
jgi:hypothetical protein